MKTYILSLVKQTEYGIDGHIYEHVIANKLFLFFSSRGYRYLLDYVAYCNNHDGIVVITIESNRCKLLNEARRIINSSRICKEDVHLAVLEIASEYMRKPRINIDSAYSKLCEVNGRKWTEMTHFKSESIIKGAGELKSPIGSFGGRYKNDFDYFSFVYTIDRLNPELRTLAVYIIQALGIMQIHHLQYRIPTGYDAGDEWAEYHTDLTGYAHQYTIPKTSKLTLAKVKTIFEEQYKHRNNDETIRGIKKYILRDLRRPNQFFSHEKMFAFSYHILGNRATLPYVTDENIRFIISKINLEIKKEAIK